MLNSARHVALLVAGAGQEPSRTLIAIGQANLRPGPFASEPPGALELEAAIEIVEEQLRGAAVDTDDRNACVVDHTSISRGSRARRAGLTRHTDVPIVPAGPESRPGVGLPP